MISIRGWLKQAAYEEAQQQKAYCVRQRHSGVCQHVPNKHPDAEDHYRRQHDDGDAVDCFPRFCANGRGAQ